MTLTLDSTKVIVKYLPNILEEDGRKQVELSFPSDSRKDWTVRTFLQESGLEFEGKGEGGEDLYKIIVSGKVVKDLDGTVVEPGDEIIITPNVGFFIGAIIGAFVGGGIIASLLKTVAIVLTVAAMIYAMVSKPRKPNFGSFTPMAPSGGLDEGSPTYGWDGIHTVQDVGISIPVIYGEHRVGGNVINQYVRFDDDKNYLNILLAIGEGEIESISDIKINDNDSSNFDGITITTKMGTNSQDVIPNFEDAHNVYDVTVELLKDSPHSYTTIDSDVEAFEVYLNFWGGLYTVGGGGSLGEWTVTYKIEWKRTSESVWIGDTDVTVTAKSRSPVRRIFRVEGLTADQYTIRITRTTDDSDATHQGDLRWTQVDEIKPDDYSYPNVALLAIEALASEQLSGNRPNITVLAKGRKVHVPKIMNGSSEVDWEDYYWDPVTEEYKLFSDGTVLSWDGTTYVDRYCANPIWCLRDLLTNTRYGSGEYITTALINDASMLTMSRYCDERVDDGAGDYEKRFRLDVVVDGNGKALDVVQQICAVFRGLPFYSGGAINVKIDKPESPSQIFTMGNIIKDSFVEQWKSVKETPNVIEVQFMDKDKDYRQEQVAYVDEAALAAGDPMRKEQLKVFTTSLSHAIREARYALKVAKYCNQVVSFRVGIDAIACQAGDVISVAHDMPEWGNLGSGRILSGSTTTSIKLDKTVTIVTGKTYKVMIRFSDDTIEERTVTNVPGDTNTLTVSSAFSSAPADYDVWTAGETGLVKKDFRILSMSKNSELEMQITALEYNENVYDDSAIDLPTDNVDLPDGSTPLVSDLSLTERVFTKNDGTIDNAIEVWFSIPNVVGYAVENRYRGAKIYYRNSTGGDWIYAGYTEGSHFSITEDIDVGETYYVAVTSVSWSGAETGIDSAPSDDITISGKTTAPATVTNFASSFTDLLTLTWDKNDEADIAFYEVRDEDANWGVDNANRIYRGQVNSYQYRPDNRSPGPLYIKAVNTSGIYGATAASVNPTNAAPDAPTGLGSYVFFNVAQLYWDNVSDNDIQKYQIYMSETGAWAGEESLESEVSGRQVIVEGNEPVDGTINVTATTEYKFTDSSLAGAGVDAYVGDVVEITEDEHQGKTRVISAFNNSTGEITVSESWITNPTTESNPSLGTKFVIYDRKHYKVRAVDSYGNGTFTGSHTVTYEMITESMLGDNIVTARKVTTGELITLSAQIKDAVITSAKIISLYGDKIVANTITSDKLSVSQLSAIAADLGTITAGTVTGATIQTASSGSRIVLTTSNLIAYDNSSNEIFKIVLTGADVGDVIIGDYSNNKGIKWDASTGTFDIRGTLTGTDILAGTVGENQIASSAISQAKLKTSTGSVSDSSLGGALYTLPGGEYGFYPQVKGFDAGGGSGGRLHAAITGAWEADGSDTVFGNSYGTATYATKISIHGGSSQTSYAQQRYVTSSGPEHWIFAKVDKSTGLIVGMYEAPDHPATNNGGDFDLIPHPFDRIDESKYEVILIHHEPVFKDILTKRKRNYGILEVVNNEMLVDDTKRPNFRAREVIRINEYPDDPWGKKIATIKTPSWAHIAITPEEVNLERRAVESLPQNIKYKELAFKKRR